MKKIQITLLILMASVSMQAQNVSVPIDENHFPDPGFRQWLSQNFQQEEIPTVTDLRIIYDGGFYDPAEAIRSLKGIEYFESLERVRLAHLPNVHTFDFSKNIRLVSFSSDDLSISEIDFSGCQELAYVTLHGYGSQSLSFTSNQKLRSLTVLGARSLKSLDLSANSELTGVTLLHCNNLEKLDLSNNTSLTMLTVYNSGLTSLDLSSNKALQSVEVYYNNSLSSILLSQDMMSLGTGTTVDLEHLKYSDAAVNIQYNSSLKEEALDAFVNSLPIMNEPAILNALETPITESILKKAVSKGWIVFFNTSDGKIYNTYDNQDMISTILPVTVKTDSSVIYDLQGRRVKDRSTNGVYIINGQKRMKQ